MSSRRSKIKGNQILKILVVSIVVLAMGYYALNHISTREKPPLGNTFYIVVGCAMIAASLLTIIVTLKKIFFPKRRRSSSRQVFLNDESNKRRKE